MTAMFFGNFTVILIMSLETSFTSYLLKANFDMSNDKAAETAANLGFFGDIGSISTELLSGTLMDIFGRKTISVGGLFIASIVMFCKPLLGSLAGLYALKIVTNISTVPLMYSPYPVDYV